MAEPNRPTPRTGLSVRATMVATICTLGATVVGVTGMDAVGAWQNRQQASQAREFDAGANRFVAGLFEVLMERLATNNALQAEGPADAATHREIETRRAAVKANFEPGLAALGSRSFPNDAALLRDLRAALGTADQARRQADAAIVQPRDQRPEALRASFIPIITASVDASLKVWFSALHEAASTDPKLARLATIKEVGWRMRDIAGAERSNVAQHIAARTPITPERLAANAAIRARVDLLWAQLENLTSHPSTHPAITQAMGTARLQYFQGFRGLADQMRDASTNGARYSLTVAEWVNTTTPQLGTLLDVMYAAGRASEAYTLETMSASANADMTRAILLLLGAIAVAAGALLLLMRRVLRPLGQLNHAMQVLGTGDTTVGIMHQDRTDEIGGMAKALQVFKENAIAAKLQEETTKQAALAAEVEKQAAMRKLADDFQAAVGGVVGNVSSAAVEMQGSAQALSATAERTSVQAGAVGAATEQASANVQTVAASAEQLAASVSEISRQVASSAAIAQKAVGQAQETDAKVQGLSDAAGQIGDVVRLIADIASRTNLLALNATIEAARAGEAGKGFAVVAAEVKTLATQTARATEEIGAKVAEMQNSTAQSVEAIRGIGQVIGEMSGIAAGIASAVEQQGAATQEIARNVQEAAKGTQEVASNITGVTQASSETGAAATHMLGAATGLSQQAETLRTEVNRFLATVRAA